MYYILGFGFLFLHCFFFFWVVYMRVGVFFKQRKANKETNKKQPLLLLKIIRAVILK